MFITLQETAVAAQHLLGGVAGEPLECRIYEYERIVFLHGVGSWISRDEIPWALPNFGVVPGGNLSVFETGAVDVISWNFLEFSCALLALRVEDYVQLRKVLEPGDFDLNSRAPGVGQRLSAVPDPETSLLMGQGLPVSNRFAMIISPV